MRIKSIFLFLCLHAALLASPFQYDLDVRSVPGVGAPTLCMHGYSDSGKNLLRFLTKHNATKLPLVTFNFPDHDLFSKPYFPHGTCFGTIDEFLPPLYIMKKIVIDESHDILNLYGISLGGCAVVNCLAILNGNRYEEELQTIGIGIEEKKRILEAVQKGKVLLDVPLKSIEEIIDFRGETEEFAILAERYRDNVFRPIDNLPKLSGLCLNIVLFFQSPDKILANRDDELYIERLKQANVLGQTRVLIADHGGHSTFHPFLWE